MQVALHWFRRDFRLADNTALHAASLQAGQVVGVFLRDPRWFSPRAMGPFQAAFWLESLRELQHQLKSQGIPLVFLDAPDPVAALLTLARRVAAGGIFYNRDYEPDQVAQDVRLEREAAKQGLVVASFKDQVIFQEQEILTQAGGLHSVFTPYKRAWLKEASKGMPSPLPAPKAQAPLLAGPEAIPTAPSLGFEAVELWIPPGEAAGQRLLEAFWPRVQDYRAQRDLPARHGTSLLSAHLSAGTVSIRQCMAGAQKVRAALAPSQAPDLQADGGLDHWIGELIWREFYKKILFQEPDSIREAFNPRYRQILWDDAPDRLAAWKAAQTGYPMVDAGMAQLRQTGWMHNRLRMITAMFLTKDLGLDWRAGEAHFRTWLMDYDQAANVGGWQWSAGTGADAAPYFRVLSPTRQGERFDPEGLFVRRWIPALARVPAKRIHEPWKMTLQEQQRYGCRLGVEYPHPIVDHATARREAIGRFRMQRV